MYRHRYVKRIDKMTKILEKPGGFKAVREFLSEPMVCSSAKQFLRKQ